MPLQSNSVIILFSTLLILSTTFSSLRFGSDNTYNDVVIAYRNPVVKYYLILSTSFEYFSEFIVCIR